jgi:hypothetical protein
MEIGAGFKVKNKHGDPNQKMRVRMVRSWQV